MSYVIMTDEQWVERLKKLARTPSAYKGWFPYNLLFWDGQRFSADCSNLEKALFNGRDIENRTPGSYAWPIPATGDCTEYGLLIQCSDISTDFSRLKEGEPRILYKDGHIGAYLGQEWDEPGQGTVNCVESTPAWEYGIQFSYVDKAGRRFWCRGGSQGPSWTHHGLASKWVQYTGKDTQETVEADKQAVAPEVQGRHYGTTDLAVAIIRGKFGKENILEDLRIEARELFTEMGESLDNAGEFSRLNDGFSDVIRRKRDIEMAFSKRNPWLGYYRDLEWKNTPFGYVCEDRNEGWKVDPEAAEIVRLIFAEAASGKSTGEIAKVLNQKGCKTPDKRKYKNAAEGSKNDPVIVETNVWDSHKVKRTLKNEQYTGVRIAHLTKINKAGKTVKTAPEEQFRFENDHEALVSPEVFQLAQQALMVQGKKPKRRVSGFLFSGLLRCGKCHRSMSYSKNMSTVYCRRELSLGDSYEGTVLVEDVKAKTWEALKSRAELAKCLLEEQVEKPDVEKAETEIQKLKDALMDRYEAFADGKITKVEFIRYRDENKVLTAKLEQELSLLKGKEEYLVRRKEALVPLAQIAGESELTREMLLKVVDVVYWQDGEVKLKLKADEFLGEKTKGK